MSNTFERLDPMKFLELIPTREAAIKAASSDPLPKEYPVNALARRLHPKVQHLVIAKVIELDKDCKRFEFAPNKELGTTELAVFSAGQYLSVFLNIDGKPVNRAYSISSTPKDAMNGKYVITVKGVKDGLVSEYILSHWKEGDLVDVSGPEGTFDYQPLRDAKTVIGIAGGSGITPFLSMAKAISEGTENFNLVLLYGSRTSDSILYKDAFDEIMAKTDKVKVVHVLSDEENSAYEHGFINAALIKKYAPNDKYSVFMCGPQQMYKFVDKELESLGLEQKYIRHELFGEFHNPQNEADYPANVPEEVTIKVTVRDKTYEVKGKTNCSILQTLESNGIAVASRCRSGECGWCHSYLASGEVYIPKNVDGRRQADAKYGYIHPCCSFPLTDIVIEVPSAK